MKAGCSLINDDRFAKRAEIIWEKGTNRAEFFRGEVNKYGWVDIGSSFLPSEIIAAYLWAQLENIKDIQAKRIEIFNTYKTGLQKWADSNNISLPVTPGFATDNGHMFYLVCRDIEQRTRLIAHLKESGIHAVFHYQSLHKSEFYKRHTGNVQLPYAEHYTDCLVRLPFFYELTDAQQAYILEKLTAFH